MKMKQLSRFTTLVLALLLCMSVCLQTASAYYYEEAPSETQAPEKQLIENPDEFRDAPDGGDDPLIDLDPTLPVFDLIFEKGKEEVHTTAFYVRDTHGDGSTYLITANVTTPMAADGYDIHLAKAGYYEEASYICTKGNFAFYYAPGLEEMQPLLIADSFTSVLISLFQNVNSDGEYFLDYDLFNILGWKDYGSYYLHEGHVPASTVYLGSPCMELNTMRIAGLLSTKNDGQTAVISLLDLIFLPEAALFDVDGNVLYEPPVVFEGVSTITYVIVGVVIVALIFILTRKSKSPAEEAAPLDAGNVGHTVSLDRGPGVQPISPLPPVQPVRPVATAQWQIRAIGGQMDGKVYMLTNTLRFGRASRCDVAFPQNAPGISGEHCEVSVEGGRAVLRDLGSSYGTFLNKTTKLEARISYSLQMGDTFTLADGGQTFRLEKAGAAFNGTGPSVRRVDTGETFSGDMSGQITFGREMRNAVTFAADSGVSNNHCVLYKEGGQLYLKDVGSTNGTFFAEDKRLKPNHPYKVKKGVSFFLVSRKFSFTITEE